MKKLLLILLLCWFGESVAYAQNDCLKPTLKLTDTDGVRLDSVAGPFRSLVKLSLNKPAGCTFIDHYEMKDARIILGRGKSIVSELVIADFANSGSLTFFLGRIESGDKIAIELIKPMAVSTTGKKREIYVKPAVMKIK
jgi:hypothetical protein